MNREERAKQFLPFDALKGLREELQKREEEALLTARRQLSEEEAEKLSKRLCRLKRGQPIELVYYDCGKYRRLSGEVLSMSTVYEHLIVAAEGEKYRIAFCDIYRLKGL